MTCCVEDISFAYLLATGYDTKQLQNQEWVELTAKVAIKHNRVYNKKAPFSMSSPLTPVLPEQDVAGCSIECATPRNPIPRRVCFARGSRRVFFSGILKNPLARDVTSCSILRPKR